MRAYTVFTEKGEFVQASSRQANAAQARAACNGRMVEIMVDDKTMIGRCESPAGTLSIEKGLWKFTADDRKDKKALTPETK